MGLKTISSTTRIVLTTRPSLPPHRRREMSDEKDATCPECKSVGIEFRGKGLDMQYKICSAYRGNNEPPGHPPMAVVKDKIRDVLVAVRPSGRFA
jgi:hypothetical protein